MILIEIRGKVFNPEKITEITKDRNISILWFNTEDYLIFNDITPHVLASEINDAIYDHEYFLEQKRIEARNHFTNPLEK